MSRRTAAALMITRGEGRALEVYLAERAPELRFFGGYWAMPGGTIGRDDLAPPSAAAPLDEDAALQICADRELFEETGLLRHGLPPQDAAQAALREHRRLLLEHERRDKKAPPQPSPWHAVVADAPAPPELRALCRIETPAFSPVRYDTVFFHVPVEGCVAGTDGVEPDVWEGELTQGRYWRPEEALASWRSGELLLVPPVIIMLEHLEAAADFEQFAEDIAATADGYRGGDLHQVRFSPGVVLAPLQTPTLPPATTTNCYIIGHDELWVVDPGSPDPQEQQRLLHMLDTLTADGQRLAGVLLTHHHPDHVGGVQALCEARGLKAHGHPRTLARISAEIPRGDELIDGAVIPLGDAPDGRPGWQLEALHTPGHDQGHLCFHESRYGAMIVGDMLSTISTIIIDPPEGHLATYLRSLERLEQHSISTLYPAHGPAVRNGRRLIQKYLRHRNQREAALVKALSEQPGDVAALLPRVYWDADERLYPFAARSLQAGLEKLAEEGRASERDGTWRLDA
ncbi:MAG: MBL fold metallo-hydrolase [Planctomycetota bacterium]|nr:MBL fold metallo-hydrolase [Planctomycetota bacterium]